eukprot:1383727-Rhodomonas_salina.5
MEEPTAYRTEIVGSCFFAFAVRAVVRVPVAISKRGWPETNISLTFGTTQTLCQMARNQTHTAPAFGAQCNGCCVGLISSMRLARDWRMLVSTRAHALSIRRALPFPIRRAAPISLRHAPTPCQSHAPTPNAAPFPACPRMPAYAIAPDQTTHPGGTRGPNTSPLPPTRHLIPTSHSTPHPILRPNPSSPTPLGRHL